jgi:alginate O-acetyltransferase complex protein AlgI
MVFSSIIFLIYFFPFVFTAYRISPVRFRNFLLLFASLIFYAWGAPRFIYLLLPLTALDFLVVRKMYALPRGNTKRWWLTASILINMGILAYFKYANFFIDNVNAVLHSAGFREVGWTEVALPIGISFFCFETLTYSIDAYRGVIRPLEKLSDYYLYIFFFPKLIAGPIVRFNLIEKQMQAADRVATNDDILLGFWRFMLGLAKKVLIANVMAEKADLYLDGDLDGLNATTAWIGMLAYTFQIYFDFSGYSDMALGMSRMLGFRLPENFDNPYTSKSISEFWRRWHMTLGGWMKEYLYIPLGGNKVDSRWRLYFNLWVVFLISGLWHGASWNFVIWGAFHGIFLVLDRLFLLKFLERIGPVFSNIFTFLVVVLGWVFFRMETFSEALTVIRTMVTFDFVPFGIYDNREFLLVLSLAVLFAFFAAFRKGKRIQDLVYYTVYSPRTSLAVTFLSVVLFILCVGRITSSGFNPFIYYRF